MLKGLVMVNRDYIPFTTHLIWAFMKQLVVLSFIYSSIWRPCERCIFMGQMHVYILFLPSWDHIKSHLDLAPLKELSHKTNPCSYVLPRHSWLNLHLANMVDCWGSQEHTGYAINITEKLVWCNLPILLNRTKCEENKG